jgi:putative aldouronate transport system substrate-binding protein
MSGGIKMLKRRNVSLIVSLLAAGITASVFAGCGKKPVENPAPVSSGKASDKPIEVRMFAEDRVDAPWSSNSDAMKELAAKTNVSIKFEVAPQGNADEKFNIMIASGDLPDIINYTYDKMMKYADKGAYEPLNDLIEKNAPNIKKVLGSDKNYKKELSYTDGKIYVLPNVGAIKVSELFFLRKDWMDKLSLKTPETLDDWYNMFKAFKEKDPNGNGKADEIPYSVRNKRTNIIVFAQAWGLKSEEFFLEDGKVKFGATDQRMRDALTWVTKLYKEGLIDKDYLTNDVKLWQARFSNEVSGVTHDWISRLDSFNNDVKKVNPKADFQSVLPPKGPKGDRFTTKQQNKLRIDNGCAAIAASSKYKNEVIKMFDYMFSEEGSLLMNFGIKDKHYKMENGNPVYTELITKNPEGKSVQSAMMSFGMNRDWPMVKDVRYENQLLTAQAKPAMAAYEQIIVDGYPKLKFTEKERETINSKFTEIKTYKDEMLDKFITGSESLDKFDAFVEKVKKMGIDEVLKVHEEALKRYNQN